MTSVPRRRTILIADPDLEVARTLKKGLQDTYEILVARDGSKALELSVLRYPDLIFFYRNCPLIGATQFLRILRSNPRTEDIPLIVLSDEEVAAQNTGYLDGVLVKPLNLDEVRAHIAQVFRRSDAVREVGHEGGAVSGSLEQISMADLLQVFSMNRRTGVLQLQSAGTSAEVYVRDGRIEEALCVGTRGEKALYRVIGFRAGQFSFSPGRTAPSVSLDSTTDALLIEGMRQADELERLRAELPPSYARLEQIVAREDVPPGLHPVTAELLEALPHAARVSDLIDRSSATDLDANLALRSLIAANIVRVVARDAELEARGLFTQDEIFDLRSRLRRVGLPPTFVGTPKLVITVQSAAEARTLAAMLARWPEFQPTQGDGIVTFGAIGVLALDQGLAVDVFAMTNEERLLPLCYAMTAGTVAAIIVGTRGNLNGALRLLEIERRAAMVFVRRSGEPSVGAAARRTVVDVSGFDAAELRLAVQTALRQGGTTDLRGITL